MATQFPENFYWGAATSAHQVEGGNRNDWSEWEQKSSKFKVQSAKLRKWPDYILNKYPSPLQGENYISGEACDHYNRYEEDFDIAKSLWHNAHRFSIEWSRIEPEEGKWDEREIEHYRQVISALRARGMEPFVTLWHWPVPLWMRDKGGVVSRSFPEYFSRYVGKIVKELSDVKFWITLNEPEIFTVNSYLKGVWPPQKKRLFSSWRVFSNLTKAHNKVYGIIKNINPLAQVGIAKNNIYFEIYQNRFTNLFSGRFYHFSFFRKLAGWLWNSYFLNRIKNHQDFIGLNYYFSNRIDHGFNKNENKKTSDMGWELYPEGIYYVLKDLKKYGKPIYITENGLADARDEHREWFIKETLKNVLRAIGDGVDVRGYFYWSLLDNFEWDKGFWPRFGLVEVDYKTMERKIRPSAYEYAKIIKNNSLDDL